MRLPRLADKPLQFHTKVGFVVAAMGFVFACFVGYLFGPIAAGHVVLKGVLASFVLSFVVGLFTTKNRLT